MIAALTRFWRNLTRVWHQVRSEAAAVFLFLSVLVLTWGHPAVRTFLITSLVTSFVIMYLYQRRSQHRDTIEAYEKQIAARDDIIFELRVLMQARERAPGTDGPPGAMCNRPDCAECRP